MTDEVAEKLISSIKIPLSQGQFSLLDEGDYEKYGLKKWCAQYSPFTKSFYAVRNETVAFKTIKRFYLHRFVCGLTDDDERDVDHINHDTLDNRKSNLRVATRSQNCQNSHRGGVRSKSGLRGAYLHSNKTHWYSVISVNGKRVYLGTHSTKEEAAAAYREAARRLHGDFSPDTSSSENC